MANTPDWLPGTLDLLILRTLQKEALQINQGSLYPALHRLEHQGWVEAAWKVSELAIGRVMRLA